MLTWRCNYINYATIITKLIFICRKETHVHRNKFQLHNHDTDGPATLDKITLIKRKEKYQLYLAAKKALLVLLSTFYAFKEYTEGCSNFYQALEIIFLSTKRDSSKIKVNRLMAAAGVELNKIADV